MCVDRSQWDEESTVVNLTPEMVNAQFSLVDASLPAEDSKPARLVSLGSASSGRSPLGQHFQLSKQKTKTEDTHTKQKRRKKEETHTQIQRIKNIKKQGTQERTKTEDKKKEKKEGTKNNKSQAVRRGKANTIAAVSNGFNCIDKYPLMFTDKY